MLSVAICDDSRECGIDIKNRVEACLAKNYSSANFTVYESGRALLESSMTFDLLFLDIDMPNMDGIEVGRQLRRCNTDCKIIIVTALKERFKEAFMIKAFRFVTKPISENELEEAVFAAIRPSIGEDVIKLYENRIPYQIRQCDIGYICACNGQVEAFVGGRILRKKNTLKGMIEELDSRLFVQVSRQVILNLGKITKVDGNRVICQKETFRIARRMERAFAKKYMEYDLKYR